MPVQERINEKGVKSYRVQIRKKGCEITKTFCDLEDANLFEYHRTRLIDCMSNFDIPIEKRVRLSDIIDLKIKRVKDKRTISEFELASKRVMENIQQHTFLCELTYSDWLECAKKIFSLTIPIRGNAKTMVNISPVSVRRIFATLSSAFSCAIANGIPLENYPLQVVQKYINPGLKKC